MRKCDSAAELIYLAGNRKFTAENSRLIIHQAKFSLISCATNQIEQELISFKVVKETFINIIQNYLNISKEDQNNTKYIIATKPLDKFIYGIIPCLKEEYKYHCYITSTVINHNYADKEEVK